MIIIIVIIIIIIIVLIIDKELEELEKYQLLKDEIAKVWRMQKVHCSVCCCWGSLEPYQSALRSK